MSRRHSGYLLKTSALPLLGLAGLAGLAGFWLAACHSILHSKEPVAVQSLTDGPTRWIMLPEEEKQARRLRTNREAITFIEDFWRRRDPDPQKPGNPFVQTFNERVEAADRLYGEGVERGSMTDRGRALVLLGPPPRLSYSQRPVPAWEPGRSGGHPQIESRKIAFETWSYTEADLPPRLVELLKSEGRPEKAEKPEIILVFAVETSHTTLMEGAKLLDLAARATVRE
ncbi:MAG TPA: GWxTD domain-containing protein [Thermoanaerobaculia bacterium]|nr:GWxTD domain-containing protein [Thermoanaerobaculia bacterium]